MTTTTQATPIPLVDLQAQVAELRPKLDNAWMSLLTQTDFVGGKAVTRFENNFAAYCQASHCVGVGNGTDALDLIFRALLQRGDLQPGDAVIVPAMSFIATAEILEPLGLTIQFADIDPVTYTLDPASVRDILTDKTRVLLPVHLYGHPADMTPLQAIATEHDLLIVEDAAQAHGAECNGQRIGSLGLAAAFSFYPGKNLGAFGDGGAVTTNDKDLADRIRQLANHGRTTKYEHAVAGLNSRLDTLQAAVLDLKLTEMDAWNHQRRYWAERYTEQLSGLPLSLPFVAPGRTSVFHLYVVQTDKTETRDALLAHLNAAGIGAGIHYPIPLHLQPAFSHLPAKPGDFPAAEQLGKTCLSLPLYPHLTEADVDRVVATVRDFFGEPA
ncbi:MAG: DegT/DnrJ/EryC1/StrS family aminotransferase [Candidatus Melainabacteria bacterium]